MNRTFVLALVLAGAVWPTTSRAYPTFEFGMADRSVFKMTRNA